MFELGFSAGAVDLFQDDLNADGIPDVMVFGGISLEACFGAGDGSFACEPIRNVFQPDTAPVRPWALAWTPLSRVRSAEVAAAPSASIEDGIVLTSIGGSAVCTVNGDDFECDSLDRPTTSEDAATADFDGDGITDVALANWYYDEARLRLSPVDRVCFGPNYDCVDLDDGEYDSFAIVATDLDGDGNADLVLSQSLEAATSAQPRARVCWGDGAGRFDCLPLGDVVLPEGGLRGRVGIADFNADGLLDVVLPHGRPNEICFGGGDRAFECREIEPLETPTQEVAVGDFDENGYPDAFFTSWNPDRNDPQALNRLCLNNGFGSFSCAAVPDSFGANRGVDAADVNGDGHLDVLIARWDQFDRFDLPDKDTDIVCFGDGTGAFDCQQLPGFDEPTEAIAATIEGYVAVTDENVIVCPIVGLASDCRAWGRPEQLPEGITGFSLFPGGG
jgi:hypothetical protein